MKTLKKVLALVMAVVCMTSIAATAFAVNSVAEVETYTVTANLFVPQQNNEILRVNAYLTTAAVMPTSPASNNATLTKNTDGTYTLSVPVVNNTFALIELGTPTDGAGISNIAVTRNSETYGSNTDGRITNVTMTIEKGVTSVSFEGSHEYSGYFISPGDKYFNLQLDVDWSNIQ